MPTATATATADQMLDDHNPNRTFSREALLAFGRGQRYTRDRMIQAAADLLEPMGESLRGNPQVAGMFTLLRNVGLDTEVWQELERRSRANA